MDIIERLRADADAIQRFGEERHGFIDYKAIPTNAREAAAEIVHLRRQVSSPVHANCHEVDETNLRLMREIEQLKADRAGDQQKLFHYENEILRLEADKAAISETAAFYLREIDQLKGKAE